MNKGKKVFKRAEDIEPGDVVIPIGTVSKVEESGYHAVSIHFDEREKRKVFDGSHRLAVYEYDEEKETINEKELHSMLSSIINDAKRAGQIEEARKTANMSNEVSSQMLKRKNQLNEDIDNLKNKIIEAFKEDK